MSLSPFILSDLHAVDDKKEQNETLATKVHDKNLVISLLIKFRFLRSEREVLTLEADEGAVFAESALFVSDQPLVDREQ